MRSILAAAIVLCVAGCSSALPPPPPVHVSSAEVDRSCILAASDRLRAILRLESSAGRALPAPDGNNAGRVVELDTTNAGLKVTYVFACSYDQRQNMGFAAPMGRK